MSDFFEATVADGADAKLTSNWLMGEVLAYLNKQQKIKRCCINACWFI